MKIKVVIADDHPMVISGLRNILSSFNHIEVLADYRSGGELLDGLQRQLPDVLLLDIHFPDTTGTDLAGIILEQYPGVRILVITSVENPFQVQTMIRKGCLGYVLKSAEAETIRIAIEQVYEGAEYIDPQLKEQLLDSVLHPSRKKTSNLKLTNREQQILELVCAGLNNYEIGERLFVSHRTVDAHRRSLYQKFDAKNVADLVRMAIQHGFVS